MADTEPADETQPAADQAAPGGEPEAATEPAGLSPDLHAERDSVPTIAPTRRGPWRRRIAVAASIAVLLVGGAAAAGVYLGRDQICQTDSLADLANDWGLCPAVVVPADDSTDTPEADDEPAASEGGGWNIDPLAWLGPQRPDDPDDGEPAVEPEADSDANEPLTPASQRALARQYLETQPSPAEAFSRATELLSDGQVEAAFLIFRYAAERGSADAATAVAAMYDPETYTPQTSPLPRPNPAVARIWYERAVAAGDDQALLSLARMLAAEDAVEDARAVLQRAEEAGLVDAVGLILEELQ